MFVGFDTSNYTTSVASVDESGVSQHKTMLTVKAGERGLRQSEAVFQHTVNMPSLLQCTSFDNLEAVGVTDRPRLAEGSYMPCFSVGVTVATAVARAGGVPLFTTSHQVGHILAALYSAQQLALIHQPFYAFHLSGGTTEMLRVSPDKDGIVKTELIAFSTDLKAGQAIDRAGVMMGLRFPCGKELDEMAQKSERDFKIRPSMNGLNCSLSGIENKAHKMFDNGESKEDIARFVLQSVVAAVEGMAQYVYNKYGTLPLLFSGGVSSNSLLKESICHRFDNAYFAARDYALDNAVGAALYAKLKCS